MTILIEKLDFRRARDLVNIGGEIVTYDVTNDGDTVDIELNDHRMNVRRTYVKIRDKVRHSAIIANDEYCRITIS